MITYTLYFLAAGFAIFLVGMSVFMRRENRKFGDNQFTVKLLPPPPRIPAVVMVPEFATMTVSAPSKSDWTAIPSLSVFPAAVSVPQHRIR